MRARPAYVMLAAVLLSTACTGGSAGKPQTLPSITSSPTPTFTEVLVPKAAGTRTAQGADAYVRFFFTELNEAFRSSNSGFIAQISTSECETCLTYTRALDASRASGEFIQGDSFAVTDVAAPPLQALGALVDVFGTIPARSVVNASGKVIRSLASDGKFHFTVAVKWIDGRWMVSALGRATS